ncbi:bacillithiol biosynthesis cysteine-adding enzyme BshC [Spongiimicrobium sp. 2-473A-2-J]|uniref:bacillithiol biosynthesis cysteine-adding enzyme BshC n=1 Tax=Eudoraea algarum TaxID=3417568 RepID=UPI003D35F73D
MDIDGIPFKQTGYFSKLICDYLEEKEDLRGFYHRFPTLKNFKAQIEEKQAHYPEKHRILLSQTLQEQYQGISKSKGTEQNIQRLGNANSFTVVTGHQLNLFTGPLYFLYKIISTINLTRELKKAYPEYDFVPVYWMATEDHDFEEINFFNFKGKKLQWTKEASGAVGHLPTDGLDLLYEAFSQELGAGKHADDLKQLFSDAYLKHDRLTDATRYLANVLFGAYGLVIIDGDDAGLKKLMVPYIKKDLLENTAFKAVTQTMDRLEALPENYTIQVNPREINYFYLNQGLRERIVEQEGKFQVNSTSIEFSREELLAELEAHPERFSPNVVSRPLYQEVILPNLCYIGGGGELAYWLELKTSFEAMEVPFPVLLLRNSALVITEKQRKKIEKLELQVADLFLKQSSFINKRIREISNINIDFTPERKHLKEQFQALFQLADQTDKSFYGAVKAQEVKQLKGLDRLEKRLLQAQKRKLKDQVVRMTEMQNALFPNQSLQERNLNFSELYLEMGEELIPYLLKTLAPLQMDFLILKY